MSGRVAIRGENLWKQYRLGVVNHATLQQDLQSWWARARGKADPNARLDSLATDPVRFGERFWALQGVSFEVREGEMLGIIGRNGAGKSTLLKILSRVTTPTRGVIKVRGRIASLLEVGTGFHPELTGRENIFLNGAILGMNKSEIRRKLDEIIAFSEVEKFIDTPVKRYSSGMYVRLAFAVAAHLEPEILVIDEVLAVGDAAFQRKCLGKMESIGREGRTVLFVSHNMAAIQHLCGKSLLIDGGSVREYGSTREVVTGYLAENNQLAARPLAARTDRKGSGALRFTMLMCQDDKGETVFAFRSGQEARLLLGFANPSGSSLSDVRISLRIDNMDGGKLAHLSTEVTGQRFVEVTDDVNAFEVVIPRLPLQAGSYVLTIYCSVAGVVADWLQHAAVFHVQEGDFFGTSKLPPSGQGDILIDHSFGLKYI